MKKILIFTLSLLATTSIAFASEGTGSLDTSISTGINVSIPCNPASVSNGTVNANTCAITCSSGYTLSGTTCNAVSSGGGGGGGGGSSGPDTTTLYTLPTTDSTTTTEITRPLDLSKAEGVITRDVEITNYYQSHTLDLNKGTELSYEDGTPFKGTLSVPTTLTKEERPAAPENFQFVKAIKVGDKEGKTIKLSKPATLTIAVSFTQKIDPKSASIFYYNEETKQYENIGGTLSEDQKSITVQITHFSIYAVLYASNGQNIQAEVGEVVVSTSAFQFKDVSSHWAKSYIEELTTAGVFKDQDNFRPDQGLLRAELVKILVEAFKVPMNGTATFSDVKDSDWFAPFVAAAKTAGIVGGYADGTFKPAQVVTRAEALKMIVTAAGVKNPSGKHAFEDVPDSAWFSSYIGYAVEKGIVKGKNDKQFAPADTVTRAEIAKMVSQARKIEK